MLRPASREHERPVVIITSRGRLTRRHGARGFQAVDSALLQLQKSIGPGRAALAYLDDAASMRALGTAPVALGDPAQVRAALSKIEANLGIIGRAALWIVGGDDVVPFCRVENPSDDDDGPVLTDAPYACAGDDWYHPTRPVARLPDGGGLPTAAFVYATLATRDMRPLPEVTANGYTASVWREAARDVFSIMGAPPALRMSPPCASRDYYHLRESAPRLRYYNLHGKPDGLAWYGQTDPALAAGYPDFPIAMRQSDVSATEARGATVITEACYGARLARSSVAERFLRLGAAAYFGSTAMSYGAITTPISGADLLAKEFARHLLAGAPAGDACLLAKTAFARSMMAEQGFLDPEDQKTLLSFVLYGDPTFTVAAPRRAAMRPAIEPVRRDYEVVCARGIPAEAGEAPASLLEELEQLATALMGNSDELLARCRQGTCSDSVRYRHGRLSGGRGQVLSIRQQLATGGKRSIRVTTVDGHIRKTLVSR